MSEHRDIDDRLLARHLWGDVTEEEQAVVARWMASAPDRQAALDVLRHASRRAAEFPEPARIPDANDVWRAIAANTTKEVQAPRARRPITRLATDRAGIRRIAAAIVALVGLSWFAMHVYQGRRSVSTIAALPIRDITTRRGERTTLDLADGTRVILAPDSRLRVPVAYAAGTGRGARDVQLDGEAYFEVQHDTTRPFRVHTAAGIAEDLGTTFVVTSYPETRAMRVVVASGEVAVRRVSHTSASDVLSARPLVVLRRGDLAQVDSLGMAHVQQDVDTRRYTGWTSGRLVFDALPLQEAFVVLGRWYDLDFRIGAPSLAAHPVTMTFDRASAQNVIQFFELLLNVRAERQGRVVTFVPRSGRSATNSRVTPSHGDTGTR